MLSSIAEGQGSVCSPLLGTQYLSVGASPLLYMVMWQAAAMVPSPPSPNSIFDTVYDALDIGSWEWKRFHPISPASGHLKCFNGLRQSMEFSQE